MLANLRNAVEVRIPSHTNHAAPHTARTPTWTLVERPTAPRLPAGIHDPGVALGDWDARHDEGRRAPFERRSPQAASRRPQETRLELPHESLLPLGEARVAQERRLTEFLQDDLYAGLRTDRNGPRFDQEIGRIARRLAPLGLGAEQIRELYDRHIHGDERRALIGEKVCKALPYQAASLAAAQFGLPALGRLPLGARAAVAGFATAAVDEGLQGWVEGTVAQKRLPQHRPADGFSPLLRRLLLQNAPASQDSGWREVAAAVGGVTLKNAGRAALSVGAAALGVPPAGIAAIGAVTDLVGGTAAVAGAGVMSAGKDRRSGLQWLLAHEDAPAVLKAAHDAEDAPPATAAQRAVAVGRSVVNTSHQAIKAVPRALRAAVGPAMWVKGAVLTGLNAIDEHANEQVDHRYGEVANPDVSARKRRSEESGASADAPGPGVVQAGAEPAERPVPRSDLLKSIAEKEAIAAGLGVMAAAAMGGVDRVRETHSKHAWAHLPTEGLRRRTVWTTQV